MSNKDFQAFAHKVADGCFDEVKSKEKVKRVFSYLLLLALLSTTFLAGMKLYLATFIAFILQIVYVYILRQSKVLNIKAQEAHKLRLYFSLYNSPSIYSELADLHSTLKNTTLENLKDKKFESFDDTIPHEINKVRKLYWILQENCFYNKTLNKLERNAKTWRLIIILLVLIIVLAFHPYLPAVDIVKFFLDFFSISDIYFLPRFVFIAFSSFMVIELIDNCYDFHIGSIEMERLYTKIEKLSKKPKMDELLTIISNYYAILRQTPNLSDRIYYQYEENLKIAWQHIYTSKSITKHKDDIIDTLKIFSGLLCETSNWCIIGSTARFLQGDHRIKPNDIDIITDEAGIESIIKYCPAFIYDKPIYRADERISSIYGYLMINNIMIDVIANLKGKIEDKWVNFEYDRIQKIQIQFDCWTFNLRDLDDEIDIQNKLSSSY